MDTPQPKGKLKEPWDTIVFMLMIVGVVVGGADLCMWLDQPGHIGSGVIGIIGLCMGFFWVVLRIPLGLFIGLILFFRKR